MSHPPDFMKRHVVPSNSSSANARPATAPPDGVQIGGLSASIAALRHTPFDSRRVVVVGGGGGVRVERRASEPRGLPTPTTKRGALL
jgi:hypothetical protein